LLGKQFITLIAEVALTPSMFYNKSKLSDGFISGKIAYFIAFTTDKLSSSVRELTLFFFLLQR